MNEQTPQNRKWAVLVWQTIYRLHVQSTLDYLVFLEQKQKEFCSKAYFSLNISLSMLNMLFHFSRHWLSKWIKSILARFAVESSPTRLRISQRQAGPCSFWGTASLFMERNEASPYCLTHRHGTHPTSLYLVTFLASVMRRNHLHMMNAALSRHLSLCQDYVLCRPNLYSCKYTTYKFGIFQQINSALCGNLVHHITDITIAQTDFPYLLFSDTGTVVSSSRSQT